MTDNMRTFLTALAELMEEHEIRLATEGGSYARVCAVSLNGLPIGTYDKAVLGGWVTFQDILQHLEDVQ
jgi:hypothetical protein